MTDRLTVSELAQAYEGLERREAFAGPEARTEYRAAVLERNARQAVFIAERLPPAPRCSRSGVATAGC